LINVDLIPLLAVEAEEEIIYLPERLGAGAVTGDILGISSSAFATSSHGF
jgi:hypothetical protein